LKDLAVVTLGCLFHDIGKVVQRANPNPMIKSHPIFGADFVNGLGIADNDAEWSNVVECIKYHHWKQIKNGDNTSQLAWFAFEADNLASAHDRKTAPELFDTDGNRIDECEMPDKSKWNSKLRLNSVFSSFTGARHGAAENTAFQLWFRRVKDGIYLRDQYPYPEPANELKGDTIENYQNLRDKVLTPLIEFIKTKAPTDLQTVNTCLSYLEETLGMVPPDTYTGRTNDVSLFDHLKLTAAIGSCMYSYVASNHCEWLLGNPAKIPWPRNFRDEEAYLLVKADLSGIQSFIYNISSKAALKGLRGRSFYLELIQQQLADDLLTAMGLSRANLLYLGGGGFAMLAPNTESARQLIATFKDGFNKWLFDTFKGRLYLGLEFSPLSGNQLRGSEDNKHGSIADGWKAVGEKLAISKREKFKSQLKDLFQINFNEGEECKICHRADLPVALSEMYGDDTLSICHICTALIGLGKNLPDARFETGRKSFEVSFSNAQGASSILPTWNQKTLSFDGLSMKISAAKVGTVDSYVLHNFDPYRPPKVFWSLAESSTNDFKALAKRSIDFAEGSGVERIGILRADVDNLGKVFAGAGETLGLPSRLRGMSRDALVSRSLAKFFTHYLDHMITDCRPGSNEPWALTTVYSGGDDVFLVGAWNQVIEFALFLEEKFNQYTCGALTLSAGIAIHKPSYPLYRMAEDAAEAERTAKGRNKNQLCIRFDELIDDQNPHHCFEWDTWRTTIGPLFRKTLDLNRNSQISTGFWNYLLQYSRSEKRSFYKLLYNVARLEERQKKLITDGSWQSFKKEWLLSLEDPAQRDSKCRMLETALNWLLLTRRDGEAPNKQDALLAQTILEGTSR